MAKRYLTAESVLSGHPDKLCDYIADCILDACLKKDKAARCACEVMATLGHIFVAGEITVSGEINIESVVKKALKQRGYDDDDFKIEVFVHTQSPDIAGGVDEALEVREGNEKENTLGAGDQGTVIGYATNETKEMLPLPYVLASKICKRIDEVRKEGTISGLMPDGKAQVTIEYEGNTPLRVKTIVVSVQHEVEKNLEVLKKEICDEVLDIVFRDFPIDYETEIFVNPSGRFVEGGPGADTGLTGRKLMVDTYGGLAGHGGGAFSGKDPTKVDRSGAYFARYIAKNIVAVGLADKCEVSISYAIGKADPVAIGINTFNTGKTFDEEILRIVEENFSARPKDIIEKFKLQEQNFAATSSYGHFGSDSFPWEKTDKVDALRGVLRALKIFVN